MVIIMKKVFKEVVKGNEKLVFEDYSILYSDDKVSNGNLTEEEAQELINVTVDLEVVAFYNTLAQIFHPSILEAFKVRKNLLKCPSPNGNNSVYGIVIYEGLEYCKEDIVMCIKTLFPTIIENISDLEKNMVAYNLINNRNLFNQMAENTSIINGFDIAKIPLSIILKAMVRTYMFSTSVSEVKFTGSFEKKITEIHYRNISQIINDIYLEKASQLQ